MPDQEDIHIIERLKQGDVLAFDTLYKKYFRLMCASAFFYLKCECEAKDLVQNLFLDIWEKKLYTRFHQDVKGYLFLSVKNRSFNQLKAKKVKESRQDRFAYYHKDDRVQEDEEKIDYHKQLNEVLTGMKGQKRAVIQMVYQNEKKYKEAASEMGIGVNSLKTHLKSAIKTLREAMKP